MNKYKVLITEKAKKQLKKLDKYTANTITSWLKKNLENCEDPRTKGKGLTANRSGQWRYRVGNYRIIAKIEDSEILILVLEIGHRSTIYNN